MREVFKFFKNAMKNVQFLINFAIFAQLLKFYQFFMENLGKKFEKFRNIHLYGFEPSEFIKVFIEHFMETGHLLKISTNSERISFIQMQI